TDGSTLEFSNRFRGLHFPVRGVREVVGATGGHTRAAQCFEQLVFVGQLAVVAFMDWQHHVQDGAGDEDDDRRKQNRKPKCGDRNHASSCCSGGWWFAKDYAGGGE